MQLRNFLRSTLGLKIIMGVTGAALFAFVIAHMVGNLQIYLGPDAINSYAHWLQTNPEILWPFRLGLLACVILHLGAAITLIRRNRQARSLQYQSYQSAGASWASRTMALSGIILVVFIIFHLLHFTTRDIFPSYNGPAFYEQTATGERYNVYQMMVTGFSKPWVASFYILSIALLSFHLSHGVSSMFRSLGLMNEPYRRLQEMASLIFAILIFIGMAGIPAAVLLGLVKGTSP